MVAQPITAAQAKNNLPLVLHSTFGRVCESYLQTDEEIFHCAYCTVTSLVWRSDERVWDTTDLVGVFVLTDYRIILGTFRYAVRDWVTYASGERQGPSEWLFGKRLIWNWLFPPSPCDLPDVNKLGREKWASRIHESFQEMPLFYQEKIVRKEYSVQHKGKTIDLLVLHRIVHGKGENDWFDIAFLHNDGEIVYELLQEALSNRGRLSISKAHRSGDMASPPVVDPVDALLVLKRMAEQGLISDGEYQTKKSEILARL